MLKENVYAKDIFTLIFLLVDILLCLFVYFYVKKKVLIHLFLINKRTVWRWKTLFNFWKIKQKCTKENNLAFQSKDLQYKYSSLIQYQHYIRMKTLHNF